MTQKPLDSCQRFKIDSGESSIKPKVSRCRICLQEEEPLISLPCHCKDELGKVHKACYGKWVFTHDPNIRGNKTLIQCEICRQLMEIEFKLKREVKGCKQIKQQSTFELKMVFFIEIIMLLFLISLLILIAINNRKFKRQVIIGIILLASIAMGCLLKKVYNLIIKKQIKSFNFIHKDPIDSNS